MRTRFSKWLGGWVLVVAPFLPAADINYYGIIKLQQFQQAPGGTPTPLASNAYAFSAFAVCSTNYAATNATVKPSNSTPLRTLLPAQDGGSLRFDEFFNTQSALDSTYPAGTLFNQTSYNMTMYTVNDGVVSASLTFFLVVVPVSWPVTPQIANLVAAQDIDPTADFTLSWNNLGGSSLDIVQLLVLDASSNVVFSSPAPFSTGALNGASTSMVISNNTLPPGARLQGHLMVGKPGTPNTSYSGATGVPAYAKDTYFPLATRALPLNLSLTSPTNGQSFLSSTDLTLAAETTSGLTNVAFWIDGNLAGAANTSPYTLTLPDLVMTLGPHTVTARGADGAGQAVTSAPVTLNVVAHQPPVAAITNLAFVTGTNYTFLVGQCLTSQVAVADDVRVIEVDFLVDGRLHFRRTNAPFGQFVVNDLLAGPHAFVVVALDNGGLSATSAPVVVTATNPPVTLLVTNGAEWKYYADTNAPPNDGAGRTWPQTNFNDSAWPAGWAELGFGDINENNPERTMIYGGPDGNRYPTVYFRRAFLVPSTLAFTNLILNVLRDDGVVVYLNGQSIWTNNISQTPIGYNTLATGAAPDDGTIYQTVQLQPRYLVAGTNTVAVEVHQNSPGSSDLSFDLMLWGQGRPVATPLGLTRAANHLSITWAGAGFKLQEAPSLGGWTDVAGNPQLHYDVAFPPPGPMRFYRLIQAP